MKFDTIVATYCSVGIVYIYSLVPNNGVYGQDLSENLQLFSGLDAVLNYFRNSSNPLAQKILHTFESDCIYMTPPPIPDTTDTRRKAFIVIEGNHRPSRDALGMKLTKMLEGRYLNNPAPCLIRYLQELLPNSVLRRAYYVLSLYASDFNTRVQLSTGRSVVLNGCWLDQLTFSLLKTYGQTPLPSVSSQMFSWPTDLLQPDLIFFLSMPDNTQNRASLGWRRPQTWQNRSVELYRQLESRYPIDIQHHKVRPDVLYNQVIKKLGPIRDVIREKTMEDTQEAMFLFSGFQRVVEYFKNNSNPLAKRIIETFEKDCYPNKTLHMPMDKTRRPFIVIEGNGHTSRDLVGKNLARKMNARYMLHPASCMVQYLDVIPKGTLLRRAYYVLSLYAMSFNVKAHLSTNRTVILNGYWLDQLTFSLIQTYSNTQFPAASSDVYSFPEELLPPDLIIYLHLDDDLRSIRPNVNNSSPNWYTRALNLYESLKTRYPIVVEKLYGDDRVTTEVVFKHIKDKLSSTRSIFVQDYEEVSQVLKLFTSLEDVLSYFRTNTNPLAREILSTFEQHCISKPDPLPESRKPFIIIEGNNKTSRDIISTRLSREIDALYMKHPAPCLRPLTDSLPRGSVLRRAFYILSLYATALEVQQNLANSPVLLNGYWLDQLTFALIQSFPYGRLPVVTSPVFSWPVGLLAPDVIIYINHPDQLYHSSPLARSHKNWKPRALDLYRNLQTVYNIKLLDLNADYWRTTDEIYQYIRQNHYL
ncbi:uncharacterized protein LOC124352773 [Homalodisca vitripennis]|uniref:uncharacterized protein LOC124352773 n=1 Tax=Homalodisca vitripennis TaxID=197043 RepID=UPI001EEB63C7|nr:uncharacterized protein LOC124352773 [Homalodisca vitripennis]